MGTRMLSKAGVFRSRNDSPGLLLEPIKFLFWRVHPVRLYLVVGLLEEFFADAYGFSDKEIEVFTAAAVIGNRNVQGKLATEACVRRDRHAAFLKANEKILVEGILRIRGQPLGSKPEVDDVEGYGRDVLQVGISVNELRQITGLVHVLLYHPSNLFDTVFLQTHPDLQGAETPCCLVAVVCKPVRA